jgi:serine protease Do
MTILDTARATVISDALRELVEHVSKSVVFVRGAHGSGSGVIWNEPGLVITNHHVVPGEFAEVTLHGGRRLRGRVVRRAPRLDLAALRVEGDLDGDLVVADSDRVRVGDLVVAVGNPMGERNAPSVGINATAPGETLRLAITLRPGNSGGALVNARGEVVGIPHMVTGNGLALAVSTRSVRHFLKGATGDEHEHEGLLWV